MTCAKCSKKIRECYRLGGKTYCDTKCFPSEYARLYPKVRKEKLVMESYHVIDSDGELVTEEGLTEREANATARYFREQTGERGLKVVHHSRLSTAQQAKLKEYEDKLAAEIARMSGKKVA